MEEEAWPRWGGRARKNSVAVARFDTFRNFIFHHISSITATLAKLFQGGVTYQNIFSEIILDFMRRPYTSDIGQTLQK